MGLQPGIRLPSISINPEATAEREPFFRDSHSNSSLLASKTLVPYSSGSEHGAPDSPSFSSSPTSGTISSSIPGQSSLDGLEIEKSRLAVLGCSTAVISTMVQTRKQRTNSTYQHIWEKFSEFAAEASFEPALPSIQHILSFLQQGLAKGLAWNSLKVQVSAISAFSGHRWALEPLVIQFLKGCFKVCPPSRSWFPQWNLSIVLDVLAQAPFYPLADCSVWNLTLKLTRVVLKTLPNFFSNGFLISSASGYSPVPFHHGIW